MSEMHCFDKSDIVKEVQYASVDKIHITISFACGRYTIVKKSLA